MKNLLLLFSFVLLSLITYSQVKYGPIPYSTGFESGTLDTNWYTTASAPGGRIQIWNSGVLTWSTQTAVSHTGNKFLGMDHGTGGIYVTTESWLGLNLAGKTGVRFEFWWAEWNDESEPEDGIYISDDGGTSFVKVLNLPGASYPDLQWNYFDLNLDSINTAHSLSFSATYVIKFQQRDNYYFAGGNDGFLFDDIRVYQPCDNSSVEAISACESYTWQNGITYTASNSAATVTLINSMGCDSVITLNLTINNSTYETIAITNCFNYISPSGKTWTTSGTYQDTIPNSSGCDSVLTITLTILGNKSSTVLNSNDNGPGSLRDLISMACSNDTIVFDASTNGNPMVLSSGQIIIDKNIVIMGNDSTSTIIDGGNLGRIFNIALGVTVTIDGVKLQNGQTKEGGAIYNKGSLTLNAVALTNNKAEIPNLGHTKGGAIYNKGQLTITNSSLMGNSATANGVSNSYGGAIYNIGSCVMTNIIATGNKVESFHGLVLGGVIYNGREAKFDLTNSSMRGNSATSGYYGFGGAIVNRRKVTAVITNSILEDNYSTSKKDEEIYSILDLNSITIINRSLR